MSLIKERIETALVFQGPAFQKIGEEERIRIELALQRIGEIKHFDPDRTIPEANSIVPEVDKIIYNYMDDLRPWKKENATWYEASKVAWYAARDAVSNIERSIVWDIVWYIAGNPARNAILDVPWHVRWYAARNTAKYAAWEVVRDLKGFENNPFWHEMRLYKLGLKPVDFRKVDGVEKYVVDFPLRINGERVLGCYAHGDGELLWIHGWYDDCKNLKSLKLPGVRTVERIEL